MNNTYWRFYHDKLNVEKDKATFLNTVNMNGFNVVAQVEYEHYNCCKGGTHGNAFTFAKYDGTNWNLHFQPQCLHDKGLLAEMPYLLHTGVSGYGCVKPPNDGEEWVDNSATSFEQCRQLCDSKNAQAYLQEDNVQNIACTGFSWSSFGCVMTNDYIVTPVTNKTLIVDLLKILNFATVTGWSTYSKDIVNLVVKRHDMYTFPVPAAAGAEPASCKSE